MHLTYEHNRGVNVANYIIEGVASRMPTCDCRFPTGIRNNAQIPMHQSDQHTFGKDGPIKVVASPTNFTLMANVLQHGNSYEC